MKVKKEEDLEGRAVWRNYLAGWDWSPGNNNDKKKKTQKLSSYTKLLLIMKKTRT